MPIRVPVEQTGLEISIQKAAQKAGRNLKINLGTSAKDVKSLEQPLGRITGQADEFGKSMEAANARVLAFGASVGIINAVVQSFKNLVSTTIEVEANLAKINSILKTTTSGLSALKAEIFEIAKNTEQTFDTVANAALELSRQGLSAEEVTKRLNDSLILSRLAGIDAAEAVAGLTAAVNSFSKAGLTTGEVLNKISAAANSFAVSERDLIEGFKRSASVAEQAGVSIDELGGIITAVQQRTARGGAVIGNSFKTIFTRIGRSENLELLNSLGVQITDVEGKILPATKLIENLAKQLEKLDDIQVRAVSEKIGGGFQIAPLLAALADYSSETSVALAATQKFQNATTEAYDKNIVLNQTLAAAINTTVLSVKELANTLGELGVTDTFKTVLNFFNNFAEGAQKILDGEGIGGTFARGFVKGLGTVLISGGIGLFVVLLGKLSFQLAKFGFDSLKTFLNIGTETKKLQSTQQQIVSTLLTDKGIREQILSIENSNLSAAEKKRQQAQFFTSALKEQLAITKQITAIGASVAPNVLRSTSQATRRSAGGFLPVGAEQKDISKGVGGAPKGAKPVVIPNFSFGGGKKGTMVANDSEYIVPNFAGGGSAIFNQDMVKSMGLPSGAKKINAAGGFIPNFANGKADASKASSVLPGLVNSSQSYILLTGDNSADENKTLYAGPTKKGKGITAAYSSLDEAKTYLASGLISRVSVPKYSMQTSERKKGSGKSKSDIDYLETEVSRFSSNLARNYAKSLSSDGQIPKATKAKISSLFNKGALSGFAGTIFETGLSAVLNDDEFKDYSSRTDTSRIDLPSSPRLFEKFGVTNASIGSAGAEVKNRAGSDQLKSTAKKFYDILVGRQNAFAYKKDSPLSSQFIDQKSALAKYDISKEQYKKIEADYGTPSGSKRPLPASLFSKYKLKDSAASGYIPNFAGGGALEEAIQREKEAGVPVNQIRINQDGKLRNSQNPQGIAVTNTRDEPTGRIPNFSNLTGGATREQLYPNSQGSGSSGNSNVGEAAQDSTGRLIALSTAAFALQSIFSGVGDEAEGLGANFARATSDIAGLITTLTAFQALGLDRASQARKEEAGGGLASIGGKLEGNITGFGDKLTKRGERLASKNQVAAPLGRRTLRDIGNIDVGKLGGRGLGGATKFLGIIGKAGPIVGKVVGGFAKFIPLVGPLIAGFQGISAVLKIFGVDLGGIVGKSFDKLKQAVGLADTPMQVFAKRVEEANKNLAEGVLGGKTGQSVFNNVASEQRRLFQARSAGKSGKDLDEELAKAPAEILQENIKDFGKSNLGLGTKQVKVQIPNTGGAFAGAAPTSVNTTRKTFDGVEVSQKAQAKIQQAADFYGEQFTQLVLQASTKEQREGEDLSTKEGLRRVQKKVLEGPEGDRLREIRNLSQQAAVANAEGQEAQEYGLLQDILKIEKEIFKANQDKITVKNVNKTLDAQIAKIQADSLFQQSLSLSNIKSELEFRLELQKTLVTTSQLEKEAAQRRLDSISFEKKERASLATIARDTLKSNESVKKAFNVGAVGEISEKSLKAYNRLVEGTAEQVLRTGKLDEESLKARIKLNEKILGDKDKIFNLVKETLSAEQSKLNIEKASLDLARERGVLANIEAQQAKRRVSDFEDALTAQSQIIDSERELLTLKKDRDIEEIKRRRGAAGASPEGKVSIDKQISDRELQFQKDVRDQNVVKAVESLEKSLFQEFKGLGLSLSQIQLAGVGKNLIGQQGTNADRERAAKALQLNLETIFKQQEKQRIDKSADEAVKAQELLAKESISVLKFQSANITFEGTVSKFGRIVSAFGKVGKFFGFGDEIEKETKGDKERKAAQDRINTEIEEISGARDEEIKSIRDKAVELKKEVENFKSGIKLFKFGNQLKVISETFELASDRARNALLEAGASLTTFANLVRDEFNKIATTKAQNAFTLATSADPSAIQGSLSSQGRIAELESGVRDGLTGVEAIRQANEITALRQKELDIVSAKTGAQKIAAQFEKEKLIEILGLRQQIAAIDPNDPEKAQKIFEIEKKIAELKTKSQSLAQKFQSEFYETEQQRIEKLQDALVSGAKEFSRSLSEGITDALLKGEDLRETLSGAVNNFLRKLSVTNLDNIFNKIFSKIGDVFGLPVPDLSKRDGSSQKSALFVQMVTDEKQKDLTQEEEFLDKLLGKDKQSAQRGYGKNSPLFVEVVNQASTEINKKFIEQLKEQIEPESKETPKIEKKQEDVVLGEEKSQNMFEKYFSNIFKSFGDVFSKFVSSLKNLFSGFGGGSSAGGDSPKWGSTIGSALGSLLGPLGSSIGGQLGQLLPFATGGPVRGGSGSKDDVPALLMGGEYVMRKDSVKKYGKGFMDKVNEGRMSKFAEGGVVDNQYMYTSGASKIIESSGDGGNFMKTFSSSDSVLKFADGGMVGNIFGVRDDEFKEGDQTGKFGFFAPGSYGGTIRGKENLGSFATQAFTSGTQDVISNRSDQFGGASFIGLEPESVRLTNFGRNQGSPLQRATQDAKLQAFDLRLAQINQEKQYEEMVKQRKKQIRNMWINAAIQIVGAGINKLGGAAQAGGSAAGEAAGAAGGAAGAAGDAAGTAGGGFVSSITSGFKKVGTWLKGAWSGSKLPTGLFDDNKQPLFTAETYGGIGNVGTGRENIGSFNQLNSTLMNDPGGSLAQSLGYTRERAAQGYNYNIPKNLRDITARPPGYATGGMVEEKVGAEVDGIPAMLSGGEFIMNNAAVNRIGKSNLEKMNSGLEGKDSEGGESNQRLVSKLDELINATKESTGDVTINVNSGGSSSGGGDSSGKWVLRNKRKKAVVLTKQIPDVSLTD